MNTYSHTKLLAVPISYPAFYVLVHVLDLSYVCLPLVRPQLAYRPQHDITLNPKSKSRFIANSSSCTIAVYTFKVTTDTWAIFIYKKIDFLHFLLFAVSFYE